MSAKKDKLKVKKPYWKYFKNSPTVMKIIEKLFYKKPPYANSKCEHGRVDYKALATITVKQANTILDLGKAIVVMERARARDKQELAHRTNDAVEKLNNQRQTIISLQQEVADLELIAKAREEVVEDAN